MLELKSVIGMIAGVLAVIASIPYIYSIIKGETKPARATWFIWAIVTVMLFISYREVGGGSALWVSLGYVVGVSLTALLSIKYGTGGWTGLDKVVIFGCGITILTWYITGSPFIALMMTVVTDTLGGVPTVRHAYFLPQEENKIAWIIGLSANALNLFAIEKWDVAHALYPVALFLMVGTITWLVVIPRSINKKIYASRIS